MTPLFKTSVGDSALAGVLNRARQNIEERTILDGENYKVERTGKGCRLLIAPTNTEMEAAGDTIVAAPLNMVFRGEFSVGVNYSPNDVVTVQNGDSGGAFLVAVPVPAGSVSEPSAGASFVQFSSFTFGQWT